MVVDLANEVLVRDVFPGEVVTPDGQVIGQCRIFITSHRLLAFKANAARQIELAAELILSEPRSVAANRGTLQGRIEVGTDEGSAWVNKGRGCGCSSPLKALGVPAPWTRREMVR